MHTITLKQNDLETLGIAMDRSLAVKRLKLQERNYIEARRQFEDAADKLMKPVFVARAHNNIFTWLQDQFAHSGKRFQESAEGIAAWELCKRCANGTYNNKPSEPEHPLFEF